MLIGTKVQTELGNVGIYVSTPHEVLSDEVRAESICAQIISISNSAPPELYAAAKRMEEQLKSLLAIHVGLIKAEIRARDMEIAQRYSPEAAREIRKDME